MRFVSGDEKFNLTLSSVESSFYLHTNASIFERNPYSQFTISKLKEMLQQNQFGEILLLK